MFNDLRLEKSFIGRASVSKWLSKQSKSKREKEKMCSIMHQNTTQYPSHPKNRCDVDAN